LEPNKGMVLFLAIERRLNFTIEDLAVTSPAYNYFLDRIDVLERKDKTITARKLGTEFPQYLQYERVKELVNSAILYYAFVGEGTPRG